MDRVELLQRAVEYEREGYDYYMRQSKMLHDQQICDLFKVVAQEELKHIDWLKAIISDQLDSSEKLAFLVSAQPLRDVRTGNDWVSSDFMIQDAIRANPKGIDGWINTYDKNKKIVLYCS